jgi:hypothetical protein
MLSSPRDVSPSFSLVVLAPLCGALRLFDAFVYRRFRRSLQLFCHCSE